MVAIMESLIRLGLSARTKEEAIRQAAAILAEEGSVDPAYGDSMLAREAQVPTYLGSGIAIPHGLRSDAAMVHHTAVSVAQFPDGVPWGAGETVHLAIGIAAASDEHVQVLAALTGVLQDPATAEALGRTTDKNDILRALGSAAAPAPSLPAAMPEGYDQRRSVEVTGHAGLHARPATAFAILAKGFAAEVLVGYGGKLANGKSMAALLTLGAERGATLEIGARGVDAAEAVRALAEAVTAGLGDAEEPEEPAPIARPAAVHYRGTVRRGVTASPGLAIAPTYRLRHAAPTATPEAATGDPAAEATRLDDALARAREELRALQAEVSARSGSKQAAIFLAHQELVDDPELVGAARVLIARGRSAPAAWTQVTEARAQEMEALRDANLAERGRDVRDVGRRVVRLLSGEPEPVGLALPDHPVILLAEDLAPSDTAGLDTKRVLGLATVLGGPNSHTAILARALRLPAVAGLGEALLSIPDGTEVVLDGDGGVLLPAPGAEDRTLAEAAREERQAADAAARADAYRPAFTRDGRRLETVANIGPPAEAAAAVAAGAEGVGLLRTEFLFLDRDRAPDEEEQFQALHAMTEALRGLPLIVRTLDIGGDKEVPYLRLPREDNPFLGVRGLRLCLQQPELFRPQLRAICRAARAAPAGAVKVMFPMVASVEEYREGRDALEAVRAELDAPPMEVGIMVEVPSAAAMADVLAREVDFFSIGTNDLTQYVLAIDRMHPVLARRADGLHPAVLRLIGQVVEAAHAAGKWVGVCGNLAAEREACAILIGLGVDELSVSPPSVPELKARIRGLRMSDAKLLAERALACGTAADVRALT
ncbi:phosphoenolpyruvate--protein phosphotransferase [Roseomonas xinghualingensis]|uniref:phosphoenolpyruvate--protein phosphotransferase n=1 Tax=Roseomonas xinghualingensis TaxID=2986475 RepID=UPI0021F24665|nr:phosphoenolpyruvate--protein phosphotransferase [Roseomonas sp. SXEYE001]MCV4209942.1 phosphoenolpyruvate--protein phosphotransferase [Roseomonas sp. SXEYE001]